LNVRGEAILFPFPSNRVVAPTISNIHQIHTFSSSILFEFEFLVVEKNFAGGVIESFNHV